MIGWAMAHLAHPPKPALTLFPEFNLVCKTALVVQVPSSKYYQPHYSLKYINIAFIQS